MEGIYFYWLSWLLWIIYTFFMKKDVSRMFVGGSLLIVIILSVHTVTIGEFAVTLSFIFLLSLAYFLTARSRKWQLFYMFIASMIIMLAYVSFHLLALFDPVWVFMNPTWMLAGIVSWISIMLYRDFYSRLLAITIGTCQGDFLYALILKRFSFPYLVGSFSFLDVLLVSCTLVHGWFFLENLNTYIDSLTDKGVKETKQS